jgi:hypothetical protein
LSLIGRRPQRVFSLFASRIQPKYAAAPLCQPRTWSNREESWQQMRNYHAKQWRQARAQCLMGATDSDFLPSLAPFKTASAKIPNRCQKDRAVRRVNSEIVRGIYPSRGVRPNTAHHRQRSESSGSIEIDVASLSSLRGRRRARRGFACRIWTHFRACRRRRSRSLV